MHLNRRFFSSAALFRSLVPFSISLGANGALSFFSTNLVGSEESSYRFLHPEIPAVTLQDVTVGADGLAVAVGAGGMIVQIENGAVVGYTAVPAGQGQFDAVAFGDGRFVAVGTADFGAVSYPTGAAAMSTDGYAWELVDMGTTNRPDSIAYDGNGTWGVAGSQGYVAFSTDGVTWQRATLPTTYTTQNLWSKIAYGGGQWVVASSNFVDGTSRLIFWRSADTTTWKRVETTVPISGVPELAYGDGKWVFASNSQDPFGVRTVITTDLSNFSEHAQGTGSTPNDLLFDGSQWVHVADRKIFTSPDASSWTEQTSAFPKLPPYYQPDPVYGIGSGASGIIAVGNRSFVQTSTNGSTWTLANDPDRIIADLNGILASDAAIIAVGDSSTILRSTDGGATWSQAAISDAAAASYHFQDIVATAGGYVAVGTGLSAVSSDGVTWTTARNPISGAFPRSFNTVASGNGIVLAGGTGNVIYTSTGDLTWEAHTLPTAANAETRDSLFWNGNFYLISGDYFSAALLRSADGVEWTDLTPSGVGNLSYLTTFGGDLAVVNNSTQLYHSADGEAWSTALYGSYGPPVATAEGIYFFGTSAALLTPEPYKTTLPSPPAYVEAGFARGDHIYLVGAGGTILEYTATGSSGADGLQYGVRAGDWIGKDWAGWFWDGSFPWVYSPNHGWMYVSYESETELVAYILSEGAWTYTNRDVYAWFYVYGAAEWRVLGGGK